MKRFKCNRLVRALGIVLISGASLYGATTTTANASFFPQQQGEACMAEQAGFDLNCTANDVRVSKVEVDSSQGTVECVLDDPVTFKADVTITTTANERYDYSVYLPEGSWSAQEYNTKNTCSILLGQTDGPGVDLEENQDACADISKARDFSDTHVYANETITMFCRDDDNSGKAEFNYCMAWHNKDGADCSLVDPAAPGTPSKCRCDAFDIDIFIKPDAPVINKTRVGTNTAQEPGGAFTFDLSFTNPNPSSALYITSLSDWLDEGANGSYETELNLWGGLDPVPTDETPEGIYLTESNCTQPGPDEDGKDGYIAPSGSYSCRFTVYIVDWELPVIPEPELYNDIIKLGLNDKNGNSVGPKEGYECPDGVMPTNGDNCSDIEQVNITNRPPTITVTKTPNLDQVPESGADVTYTIVVTNTSGNWDSPVTLNYLDDNKFNNLFEHPNSDCAFGQEIENTLAYECSFTEFISGAGAGSHTNVVTAEAIDDENAKAQSSNDATVIISDIPSEIYLVKTADPNTNVPETGDDPTAFRDINYTFEFGVKTIVEGENAVDTVEFMSLVDTKFFDITDDCMVDMYDDGDDDNGTVGFQAITPVALNGFELDPGQSASCTITKKIRGTPTEPHTNVATIAGTDEDGQAVDAMDSETVNFIAADASASMKFVTNSLIVIEVNNGGIRNARLTDLSVWDGINPSTKVSLFGVNLETLEFTLINEGGSHLGDDYLPCDENHELGYSGSGTEKYTCAFTIEWEPDLENAASINRLKSIEAVLTDSAGTIDEAQVKIQVITLQ